MIERSEIVINSSFGKQIANMFLTHSEGSKNIAILFPGANNSTDVPTLHYGRKAALLCGCDVLSIEYGYKIGYVTLSKPEIMSLVIKDCREAVNHCLRRGYERIFFISKSMGYFISLKIDNEFDVKSIRHISYTPVTANVKDIANRDCIVITGTKDKWFTMDDRNELLRRGNVELILLENAGHSLEIDDNYSESISILGHITDRCAEYIKRNMIN
jgi:hypothetical protein